MSLTTSNFAPADGMNIFYREAGPKDRPTILLMHGFPSSSNQYRNLIPLLSTKYHVIAPDLPGFGFTEVPDVRNYSYTFANLTTTIEAFLDALQIRKFSVYIFDYGAPTALRLALRRAGAVQAIITQNGNAYTDGLSDFFDPLKKYWSSDSPDDREAIRSAFLTFEATKWQYTSGTTRIVDPAAYHLDYALLVRPGNQEIQLDLFKDYASNVEMYPKFQEYFRRSQVPVLAIWGKNDPIFTPPGAEAFKRDLPNVEIHLLDAGHFAVEQETEKIADLMLAFFNKNDI